MSAPLLATLRQRRSIRRYEARAVPDALLEQLLEAARWAPSAHNRQPWRFALITTGTARERLALAMGNRLRSDLARDGVPPEAIERDAGRSFRRLTGAPALVLLCLSMTDMDHYPDARRAAHERTMAVQSVAMAGQNLLLAAHDLGLGACWMCAPLFCPDVVARALALPADWEPQGLIAVGYPAETRRKERRALEQLVLRR